ncbi:Uncharacterized protein EJ110_NYTH13046 [Nymphaea thermarum]|nr:Uncharacterized protein EJ110_NYTH13046 [Nymphaea thermarum]
MVGGLNLVAHGADWATHLGNAVESLGNNANQVFRQGLSRFSGFDGHGSSGSAPWARVSLKKRNPLELAERRSNQVMAIGDVEERLAGVPVYALINSNEDFVLVSGAKTGKSLGLLCFREEDAERLLDQLKSMDPGMREGSKVVAVALNKVVQLKVNGVAFRFVPDPTQVANALKDNRKDEDDNAFPGVPVFQSKSLVLRSQGKRYRPVFFRKEDLERSLYLASRDRRGLNPGFRHGDTEVHVMEDIIKGMMEDNASKWDDIIFIPPGFDVSAPER